MIPSTPQKWTNKSEEKLEEEELLKQINLQPLHIKHPLKKRTISRPSSDVDGDYLWDIDLDPNRFICLYTLTEISHDGTITSPLIKIIDRHGFIIIVLLDKPGRISCVQDMEVKSHMKLSSNDDRAQELAQLFNTRFAGVALEKEGTSDNAEDFSLELVLNNDDYSAFKIYEYKPLRFNKELKNTIKHYIPVITYSILMEYPQVVNKHLVNFYRYINTERFKDTDAMLRQLSLSLSDTRQKVNHILDTFGGCFTNLKLEGELRPIGKDYAEDQRKRMAEQQMLLDHLTDRNRHISNIIQKVKDLDKEVAALLQDLDSGDT